MLRAKTVDRNGFFWLLGTAIHIGPGGRMNYGIRLEAGYQVAGTLKIGDVEMLDIVTNNIHASDIVVLLGENFDQPPSQAASRAGHEDAHVSLLMAQIPGLQDRLL
jgi:hypothetical protein